MSYSPTQRLEDIHALEVSKADKARWEQVPPREREEKQVGPGGCCSVGEDVSLAAGRALSMQSPQEMTSACSAIGGRAWSVGMCS